MFMFLFGHLRDFIRRRVQNVKVKKVVKKVTPLEPALDALAMQWQ